MPRPATTPVTMAMRPPTSCPWPSNAWRMPAPMGAVDLPRDAAGRLPLAVEADRDRLLDPLERERLVDRACCLVATCSPSGDADDRNGHPPAPCPRRGDTTGVAQQTEPVEWWITHDRPFDGPE